MPTKSAKAVGHGGRRSQLIVDHRLPEEREIPLCEGFFACDSYSLELPNFFATSRHNVPYLSAAGLANKVSANHRERKRPRDGAVNEEPPRSVGDAEANSDASRLHEICSRCFPPPTMATSKVVIGRNCQLLKDEGLWPINPHLKRFRPGMFQCAMLRGHKECMLEMHKRGIGDEYSAVGELNFPDAPDGMSNVYAPHLEILTRRDPSMLHTLYQLGHHFLDTAMVAVHTVGADEEAENVLKLVVHEFGAKLHQRALLALLCKSKMDLVSRIFDQKSLSGVRNDAFETLFCTLLEDDPSCMLQDLLHTLLSEDRTALISRLVAMYPQLSEECESWSAS